jgi:hypothetical protein
MVTDLHDAVTGFHRLNDALAFFEGAGHRLLEVNVLARLDAVDQVIVMPVIGGSHDHSVDVVPAKEVFVVSIARRFQSADFGFDLRKHDLVDVADGNDLRTVVVSCTDTSAATLADTDATYTDTIIRSQHVLPDGRDGQQSGTEFGGSVEKRAAGGISGHAMAPG